MVFASAGAEFGSSQGPGVRLSAQHPWAAPPTVPTAVPLPPLRNLLTLTVSVLQLIPPPTLPLNKLARLKRRSFKMTATVQSELYRLGTFILNPHLWKNGFFPLVETS